MGFSGAAQHANNAAGAGYFADSSRESTDRRTRWRRGMDSNLRYQLIDTFDNLLNWLESGQPNSYALPCAKSPLCSQRTFRPKSAK
jgi:hypothetical protein